MATKAEQFDAAFINARKRGDKTFKFKGETYNTSTAEEELADDQSRPGKKYLDYVMKARAAGGNRNASLSRGAKMRADAGLKEAQGLKSGGKIRGYGMARGGKVCKMR